MSDRVGQNSIQVLTGVGARRAELFGNLGVATLDDLIALYPRHYEDWSNVVSISMAPFDEKCCVAATVVAEPTGFISRGGGRFYTAFVSDGAARMKVVFFNNKYAAARLKRGNKYLFFGKVGGSFSSREMLSPEISEISGGNSIRPIYPQTAGLSSAVISKCVREALKMTRGEHEETLSQEIRDKYRLYPINTAIENIHFPADSEILEASRRRLIFDELLTLNLGLLSLRDKKRKLTEIQIKKDFTPDFYSLLPFTPTGAQRRAVDDCVRDMSQNIPMNRLIQGDVGSGKTAVAAAVCYNTVKNGWQAAIMAPTGILAEQHYKTLCSLMKGTGIEIGLLTGAMSVAEKKRVCDRLADGTVSLVVGTHALIQEGVKFRSLGLIVTDEQHRFGVNQRSSLAEKGDNPHLLVMSATPIPRTLALIIYGDLDLSVLDELPPGRQKIETYSVSSALHKRICSYVRKHLDEGRQGYFVCPLVEDGEVDTGLVSAQNYAQQLSKHEFKGYSVGLLHGRMKQKEKDAVMSDFVSGKIQLLVSTTVVEVGVDVPNAVIMVIENAERFGLSQLHQLRGRVGRGRHKSTCILVSDNQGEITQKRLSVMCETTDGFKIADEDLKLRGPGDFFGSRQHGLPKLKIADMLTDGETLRLTADAARSIYTDDPTLKKMENAALRRQVRRLFMSVSSGTLN